MGLMDRIQAEQRRKAVARPVRGTWTVRAEGATGEVISPFVKAALDNKLPVRVEQGRFSRG